MRTHIWDVFSLTEYYLKAFLFDGLNLLVECIFSLEIDNIEEKKTETLIILITIYHNNPRFGSEVLRN